MKVRSAVRRLCRDCYVLKKGKVVYIRCKSVKKHKQRQGLHTAAGETVGVGRWGALGSENRASRSALWERVSTGRDEDPMGSLRSLPWLPAWASPSSAAITAVSSGLGERGWLPLPLERGFPIEHPLRALAAWGTRLASLFSSAGKA